MLFSNTVHGYATFYWGVPIATIEESLHKAEQGMGHNDGHNDNQQSEVYFVPIHRMLAGSYQSVGSSE